jgi:hypothetical protein
MNGPCPGGTSNICGICDACAHGQSPDSLIPPYRLNSRGNVDPLSQVEKQPESVIITPLARAKYANRRRSMVIPLLLSVPKKPLGWLQASCIKACHQHHAPRLFLEQILHASFAEIFRSPASSAKVVTFLRLAPSVSGDVQAPP